MREAFVHQPTGRSLKMGRTPRDPSKPVTRLRAARYLRHAKLPKAPDALASSTLAQDCMDRMLMNDVLSCCTTATTMKCSAQVLGDAGTRIVYSNAQAVAFYSGSTGYDGTTETDLGGNEDDVIDYCVQHGIEKNLHHWAGKLSVDGSNSEEVRQVVSLTKNLFFGANLPDAWLQVEAGAVLTLAGGPDEKNGHAFPSGGHNGHYVPEGVVVTLWGDPDGGKESIEVLMPWDVLAAYTSGQYGGELHSLISRDALRAGLGTTSGGFNWEEYAEDYRMAGGVLA